MTSTNDEKHEYIPTQFGESPCAWAEHPAAVGDPRYYCGQPRSAAIHGVVTAGFETHSVDCNRWVPYDDCHKRYEAARVCTCIPTPSATEPPTTEASEAPLTLNAQAEWITLKPCHACGKEGEWLDVDYENDSVICEYCGVIFSPVDKWNDRISENEVARLREALRGAQATIESMRSENKLHGHITDASAFYLHHSKPLIDAALKGDAG